MSRFSKILLFTPLPLSLAAECPADRTVTVTTVATPTSTSTVTVTSGTPSTSYVFLPGSAQTLVPKKKKRSSPCKASTKAITTSAPKSTTSSSSVATSSTASSTTVVVSLSTASTTVCPTPQTSSVTVTVANSAAQTTVTVAPPPVATTVYPCANPVNFQGPTYGDAQGASGLDTAGNSLFGLNTPQGASAQACCNTCFFEVPNCIQAYWYSYQGCVYTQANDLSRASGQGISNSCPAGTFNGLSYVPDTEPAFRSTGNIAGPCGQSYSNLK